MITPHTLLKFAASDVCRDSASLTAIQPSVGTPCQRVGDTVCVLHAKSGEQNPGIAVRDVITIMVRIEQQIGYIQHKDSTVTECEAGGKIEAVDEIAPTVHVTVLIRVIEDSDAISTARPMGWWPGYPIVFGAGIAIDADSPESCGVWILQILNYPQPTAIIKLDAYRLADQRFAGDQLHFETFSDCHFCSGLVRQISLTAHWWGTNAGKQQNRSTKRVEISKRRYRTILSIRDEGAENTGHTFRL